MNREYEFVTRLSRLHPTPSDLERARALADAALTWDRVIDLVESHGTTPLVAMNLSLMASAWVPADVPARLRALKRGAAVADLIRYRHWLDLADTFAAKGIPAMSLRGFHAATAIYGRVGLRSVSNLEFLIGRKDLPSAIRLLTHAGYRATTRLTASQTFTSPQGVVALHWRTGPWATAARVDGLLADAERHHVDGHHVLVPSKSTLVAMLLCHGHQSGWPRLRRLVDVAEGLDLLSPLEYHETLRCLDAVGLRPALDSALERIETHWERLPACCPDWVRPRRRAVPAVSGPAMPRPAAHTPVTLVSAIYDSGPSSLLGGRGWDITYYLSSLINIGNLGAPLVLFCPAKDVVSIREAIAPYFCDSRIVAFELRQFAFFDAFVAWKQSYWQGLTLNNRNEVLCFLKSWWVQQAVADNPFNHDRFFWIDAGLTHHGIFPERVGGVELRTHQAASQYYPANPDNIFRPALGLALGGAAPRGKVLFCAKPFPGGARRDVYEQVMAQRFATAGQVQISDHLVGGLFGGHRDDLAPVHNRFVEVLQAFIDTRTYTLEEQVFSSVHALQPDRFALQRFDTWYFCSPGERTSRSRVDGRSFYRIFTDLAPLPHPRSVQGVPGLP